MFIGGYNLDVDKETKYSPKEMVAIIREKAHPFLIEACLVHNEYCWGFEPILGEVIKENDNTYFFKEIIGENKRKCMDESEYYVENGQAYRLIPLYQGNTIKDIRNAAKMKYKPYVQSCIVFMNNPNVQDMVISIGIVDDEKSREEYINRFLYSFLDFTGINTFKLLKEATEFARKQQKLIMNNENEDIFKVHEIRIPVEKEEYFNNMEKLIFSFLDDKSLIDKYYENI